MGGGWWAVGGGWWVVDVMDDAQCRAHECDDVTMRRC